MGIPRRIKRGDSIFEFEKKYPNFYMYKDPITGIRVCFDRFELLGLGKIPQHERKRKWEIDKKSKYVNIHTKEEL